MTRSTYSEHGPPTPHPRPCVHALKARPWSVRLRLPDYGMGDIPVEQRSPSPEPIFDKNGQRVNSRLVLRRQKLERERTALVESLKPKVALRSEPDTRARAHGAWRRSTPPSPCPPPPALAPQARARAHTCTRAHAHTHAHACSHVCSLLLPCLAFCPTCALDSCCARASRPC